MPWWPSQASITSSVNKTQYQNINLKQKPSDGMRLPWQFILLYANFHRRGVILCGFDVVSSFPLKRCFLVIRYLWFLCRKCLFSSNTYFLKLFEWRDFIFGPQNGHANFPFIWRPTRSCIIGLNVLTLTYQKRGVKKRTYHKNVLAQGHRVLSIQALHEIEIVFVLLVYRCHT